MLDTLQIILWSITYVLIVIAGFLSDNEKKVSMPYTAGVLNFAWEICALYYSGGFWGHVAWFGLDLMIVWFGFRYIKTNKSRWIYAVSIVLCTLTLLYIFTWKNGMLISVFAIDLIMAACFLADRKKLSPRLKVPIAITKLLGDTFAGLYYAPQSVYVGVVAVLVFLCNLIYLSICIEEKEMTRTRKKKLSR